MRDKEFNLFWKTYQVDKTTVDAVVKEISNEVAYLSTQRLPMAKGREMTKILEKIHALELKKKELIKRFSRTKKNPFPTISPALEMTDEPRAKSMLDIEVEKYFEREED
jgi:enoyl reductase-like protein